mgnify:CR=1 FL=1
MDSYRTFYRVYDSDLDGSRPFQHEREVREYASEMEEDTLVIVRRQQKMPEGGNAWEDRSHKFIRKDFDSAFFDLNFGGHRV